MAMESGDSIDDISDDDTTILKKKNDVEADKEAVKEELTLFQANMTEDHRIDLCSDEDSNMCG